MRLHIKHDPVPHSFIFGISDTINGTANFMASGMVAGIEILSAV
jgi:hypothetical protein